MEKLVDSKQLQSMVEKNGKAWAQRFRALSRCADSQFDRISPIHTNKNLLLKILGNTELRRSIVKRLEQGEGDWDYDARTDPALQNIIKSSGTRLPVSSADFQRWTLLVSAAASVVEGFSYGNLIRSEDFKRKQNGQILR